MVNYSSFSPQKSARSVISVREKDYVSLNVYFKRLVIFYPAKATRFSIVAGTIEIAVLKQGSKAVNTKVELQVGAALAGLKLYPVKVEVTEIVFVPT